MSTFFHSTKKCAVCKTTSEYTVVGSTNTFGSPDLDLRPPQMKRSTMVYWPQRCPHCGFAAYDIERETSIKREWLCGDQYTSCEGLSFRSRVAETFYKIYMIAKVQNDSHDAINALFNAAWECDDMGDEANAIVCRKLIIPYLDKEIARRSKNAETYAVVRADVLRRAGLFEKVIEEYTERSFTDHLLTSICRFQVEKAKKKDNSCYRVADVEKD